MTGYTVNYSGGGDTGSVNVGPSTTATTITGRINDGYAYIITVEAKSVHLSGESSATAVILSECSIYWSSATGVVLCDQVYKHGGFFGFI